MTARDRRHTNIYIDGNTVRKLEAAPDYRVQREEQRREAKRRNRHVARKNQEHEMQMTRGYVAFLSFAALITALVSVAYIQIQSTVTSRMKNIAALESKIADLKADNDAAMKRLSTSVDLNTVKDVAMNQLGMVYAGKDQIIYYSVDEDDYMNQYGEIPEK